MLTEVRLPTPTVSDHVYILPAIDPDTATLAITAQPAEGNTLTTGISGSTITYTLTAMPFTAANQIAIGASVVITAANIVRAIRGYGLIGSAFSNGTAPNPAVRASASTNPRLLTFSSTDPVNSHASTLVLSITGTWATPSAWVAGGTAQPLAVFGPGDQLAFNSRPLANPVLLDATASDDSKAIVNLPTAPYLQTNTLTIPPTKPITLQYNALGKQPTQVWWREAGGASDITSIFFNHGSNLILINPTPATGNAIIPGDTITVDNGTGPITVTLQDSTHIQSTWTGFTSTWLVTSVYRYAHALPNALQGQLRIVPIGTVPSGTIAMVFGEPSLGDRCVVARVVWPVTPDD